jgi:DNA-directed RNA polymerase specialized sigma24 family protein
MFTGYHTNVVVNVICLQIDDRQNLRAERGNRMILSLQENIAEVRSMEVDHDLLMRRADLLSTKDRDLIEAVLVRGQSAASMGRLMGVDPRTVRKRISKIRRRISSKDFLAAARAMGYLSADDAELARLRYCQGLSHRQLYRQLAITSHALRRRLCALAAQIEMVGRMTQSRRGK